MADNFAYLTSSSPGAPSLSGTAGDLIAVLDYVLDVSNTTNGWEKVYTGTNKAVYRSRSGNRFFYRVVDDGSLTDARWAVVRGYESMSDVDTGVDPFPTVAQMANPSVRKSNTANSAVKTWRAIRTSRFFIVSVNWYNATDSTSAVGTGTFFFGDVPSLLPSDPWNTVIHTLNGVTSPPLGSLARQTSGHADGPFDYSNVASAQQGIWAVRTSDGSSKSMLLAAYSGNGTSGIPSTQYFDTFVGGGLFIQPLHLITNYQQSTGVGVAGFPRFRVPGYFGTPYYAHPTLGGFYIGDTFSIGERTFVNIGCEDGQTPSSGFAWRVMETSEPEGIL